jgi:GxxExxY protein
MDTNPKHWEMCNKIVGVFYDVYNELGHGFLESVYQKSLLIALDSAGLQCCSPIEIPVWFRGRRVGSFEADVLVENSVLLELKVARCLDNTHQAQLLNYLRATEIEVGLLLNFGAKPEFKRLLFDNSRKTTRLSGSA